METNMLKEIRARKKKIALYKILEELATTPAHKALIAELKRLDRTDEDDLDDAEGTEEELKAMLIHGHSGYLAHEIEAMAADHVLDMRQCVTHDGSRAYQRKGLKPKGTKPEYEAELAKDPAVWMICASSQRMCASTEQECIRRDIGGTVNWRDTLQEYNVFQNTHRYHSSIRRLALRDMATLIYPDHRELFHRQDEDDIRKFLLSMDR